MSRWNYFSVDKIRPVLLYLSLLKKSAGVAQLVERDLAKVEVTGSSPATRSIIIKGLSVTDNPFSLDCDVNCAVSAFRNCSDCFTAAILIFPPKYIDGFFLMRQCQICVAQSHLDICMTQEFLDRCQIDALHDQPIDSQHSLSPSPVSSCFSWFFSPKQVNGNFRPLKHAGPIRPHNAPVEGLIFPIPKSPRPCLVRAFSVPRRYSTYLNLSRCFMIIFH